MKKILLISILLLAILLNLGAKSLVLDSNIRNINIDIRDKSVDVVQAKDNQISIEYEEEGKESINVDEDGNSATITFASNKKWTDFIGINSSKSSKSITLYIPNSGVDTLDISTTNEDISIENVSINDSISLTNNGGNISVNGINAGNSISLQTKNGNISGTIIGSYDDWSINTKIKKGNTSLPTSKADGNKKLDVNMNNGNVNISFVK